MKKLLVAFMVMLALAPVFAGGSSESSGNADAETQIFFFHRWPNDPKNSMFNDLLAQYMEENPDVNIEMDCILNDQYKERIRMIVSTNDVPDVFSSWSGTFAEEMIASGNVLALNDIYASDPEWSGRLASASVAGFTFDGTIYGIPWSQDGKVFFYNKTIFEELGLEVPTTWTEFIAVLDALKAAGYEIPLAEGLVDQWAVLHYLGTINQRMIDEETLAKDYDPATGEFTDPLYVTALEKWQQLTTYMGDIASAIDHETARNTMFATGESPIMYLQFAEIPMLEQVIPEDFEYSFFNFPAFEEGKGDPNALTGAPEGFMISNKAENIDACVDFLKWLVSPERGYILSTVGGDMSCVDGALDGEGVYESQKEALEMIQNASYLAAWLDNACDPSVYVVYGQGGQAIATGDATPESVMAQVQAAAASLH